MTDSRVASLAALLQEALDATTVGPVKLFVPVDSEPWWRSWLSRTREELARGVQYAPRAPHDCVKQDCIGERYHNHEGEVAPPREPPS